MPSRKFGVSDPQPGEQLKILRIITRLNVGGPSIHVVLLMRELQALGYATTLATGACEAEDGDMSHLLENSDDTVSICELSRSINPWKNFRALVKLCGLMRRSRPDIVHTHTAMAGCLGRLAAFLCRAPIVVHTFHGNILSGYFSKPVEKVFLIVERFLARHTDAICVVCEQQRTELSSAFRIAPRERFRVIPLGLDLAPFLNVPAPVKEDCLRVGWFGRLVPIKNIPLLLAVVEATLAKSERVEFHVAGDGPNRDLVEAAAGRFGPRLVWHGWLNDIRALVEKCDVLIQTSRNEGTPLALIQGMAAGRPFVATPVGGLVDMMDGPVTRTANGCSWYANGVLAEAQPEAFADALIEFREHAAMAAAMGERARAFAARRYSKETLVGNLDSLYRELVQAKKFAMPYASKVPLSEQIGKSI